MLKLMVYAGLLTIVAGCASTPDTWITAHAPQCVHTGTRIHLEEGECAAGPGRSYSKEELEQTGAFTLAEALRKIDPSLGR